MTSRENYNDLHVFMLVAREGSFTRAAARLGLAQSGISRTIRELEARLGVQLLVRTTRSLSLTQAGEQLYRTALSGFQSLDAGLATLAHFRDIPSGTVRINASQHAIDKVLLPKLAIFRQRYPDIRLELISESRFVNIIDERFDAGVRLGGEVGEGMVAVRITPDMEMVMVATPDHFLQYGFPQTPAELAVHPCIAYQFADGSLYQWELWQEGKLVKHRPQGQWVFSDSYLEAAAARMGLGLAYVPEELVTDELERGTLIRVLPRFSHRLEGMYLYYPHRNVSPALRALVDTLKH
ncbi:LysR substrate-binding domain-containing protein [Aeromonas rivipollensis]|uniref:LysR family transcriptional regulator n=1 Tax=Aeromonas rivipollensis TaxID=948519 RepID=UPI0027D9A42F|nr:LysR substrate-binding domain-containing protein [uncultured Aeromonas sp.]MDU1142223.1 LysR family transcriptional regulator [Aeromonas hydrophila]